jgi:hypothetical protein
MKTLSKKPKTMQVAIDADLHRRIKKIAAANARTVGKQVNVMLAAAIGEGGV